MLESNDAADTLISFGKIILESVEEWENKLIQPKQKTFQDVINFPNQLNSELLNLKDRVDQDNPVVTSGVRERLKDLKDQWDVNRVEKDKIIRHLDEYNQLYKDLELPALILNIEK